MAANEFRGDVSLTLGERTLTLRPTYEAMAQIETEMGMGLLALVRQFAHQDIGVLQLACVIHLAAKAGGSDIERVEVGALIIGSGFADAAKAATDLLTNAVTGGQKSGKKPRATRAKKSATRP